MNTSGTTLPKEPRFKNAPVYDKGTGQTCYLGPGSYNDHDNFISLNKASCPSKIVSLFVALTCLILGLDANICVAAEGLRPAMLYHDRRPDQVRASVAISEEKSVVEADWRE